MKTGYICPSGFNLVASATREGRTLLAALASLTLGLSTPAQAGADAYPSRPITLVVGYPPGGSTDLIARTLGQELAHRLGTSVVIDNVGGAGGAIGAQRVLNAAPDGYTLLVGANNELAIKKLVAPSTVKYDSKDFTPLGLIASQPMVLVTAPHSGVKNMADFMKQVKANPGKFTYGSSGVGTALHLSGEMIKDQGGLFMVHIPYKGVAPLTTDLLGGNVDYAIFVHHRAQAFTRHPRHPGPGRDTRTEEPGHGQLVRADGPGPSARRRGDAPEEGAGRVLAIARAAQKARRERHGGQHHPGRPAALPGRRDGQVQEDRRIRQDRGVKP